MYEIRPETIKTFIEDRQIRLPRFQRKQTWDDKKNFELCISLFKQYPIGVSVLSVESQNGINTRWLLDGRQRRHALMKMYDDPENIYSWAKKYIGFRNSDQPSEIEDKFWLKIRKYIPDELDEDDGSQEGTRDNNISECDMSDETEDFNNNNNTDDTEEQIIDKASFGLKLLLEIIKVIHNKRGTITGFTKPFDLKAFGQFPCYERGGILSSKKVKAFINDYRTFCYNNNINELELNSFMQFIEEEGYPIDNRNELQSTITSRWPSIKERVLIVTKIDDLFSSSKIGLIEVKNLKPSDSQKIFEIINSKGTRLSSVEILSAKPEWNIIINDPSDNSQNCVTELYREMGIMQDNVVRWDIPATFIKRISENFIISNNNQIQKEITLGFKILSAYYTNGLTKEDIEKLGRLKNLNWNTDIEQLVSDMRQMIDVIKNFSYFQYFCTWHTTLMDISSEAIALNFMLLTYKDWLRKNKPTRQNDSNTRIFQKNCFILWDTLLYEYILQSWRGSSDSKIAKNLSSFANSPNMLTPINTSTWFNALDEIFNSSSITGTDISIDLMKPLLYHMYCLKNITGPFEPNVKIEVDHIIPQALFKASTFDRKDIVQDNLLNLGLLPKRENITKSNKRLSEITDPWLIEQIRRYEFISREDFVLYSDVNNYQQMFENRKSIYLDAFNELRTMLLNN